MREQPLDLRESLAALRRRWIIVAAIAVLGVCGGLGYETVHVPAHHATAQILLPGLTPSGAATTPEDTQTQVIIATSSSVLAPAGASVAPPISVDQLERLVSASAESTNVLRIEARAATSQRAVQLVNAVTKAYQSYVKTHDAVKGTTTVIQPAMAVTPPSTIRLVLKDALLGLMAGLLVGAGAVLVRARSDRRLRRRDQIAGAVGAPVLTSMDARRYKSVADWIRLLEQFDPSTINAWTLRPVLRNLLPDDLSGQFTIQVVSLIGDKAALATGPELALFAAASGIPTRLAPSDSAALEPLSAACAALRTTSHAEALLTFGTGNEEFGGQTREPLRHGDEPAWTGAYLVVSVVAVDPSNPTLTATAGPTILSVSSGFAAIDDLARLELASAKAGLGIDGIVVVNPDPSDSTTGSPPDHLTASWRPPTGNTHRVAGSPLRVTGRSRWRA